MRVTEARQKYREATTKVAAVYAGYRAAQATAKSLADQFCHVWSINPDYADSQYEAAVRLAGEHQRHLPGQRRKEVTGDRYNDSANQFTSKEWTWVPIKGVSPALQARLSSLKSGIEFRAPRHRDIEALKAMVHDLAAEMYEEEMDFELDLDTRARTIIMSWDKAYDGWNARKERYARTFKSVMLPAEIQAEIEADLKRFTESKDRLTRLEMPWRRGYLLSGPPGTGKTSLSLAIAGALGFNLASLSLTDIEGDGMLRSAISSLRPRTVLVIEDIDAYAVSHERDHNSAKDGALSLSGLLNSLDGFETPEGLVTIVTSNHPEKLDPALIRSGRIDRMFHLGHIQGPELVRLFEWFYEQKAPGLPLTTDRGLADAGLSPAQVAELFKQHLDDPEGGWGAVIEHVEGKQEIEELAAA